jgi:hypothetical protein
MTEKQVLGFKPAARLEQVDQKHSKQMQDRKHRVQRCDDSALRCESTPDEIFGKDSGGFPGYVAVAIGSFADPNFPAPMIEVWEESRHAWFFLPPDTPPKRMLKQG